MSAKHGKVREENFKKYQEGINTYCTCVLNCVGAFFQVSMTVTLSDNRIFADVI